MRPFRERLEVVHGLARFHLDAVSSLWSKGAASANEVAAFPSLHCGFTVLIAAYFWRTARPWLRVILVVYPLLMAFTLVGLGIRQLSVSPISLPRVKALIRGMRVAAAVEAAGAAMDAATADDAETILRAALHAEVDGELLHT